ncbi:MAG: FAD-dependent oxidoreductase, partial [Nanoarchaeota archaeon]
MRKKQLVILGGGFAGVILAQKLLCTRMAYDVTLVDKNNYFSFTPMIVETVSGTNNSYNIVQPLRQIFGCKVKVIKSFVKEIDLKKRTVIIDEGKIVYDSLIIALGSSVDYYGIPGAQEHTLPLRTVADGIAMRRRIIESFEKGRNNEDQTFVVVGGGPTGVELAGEIQGLISNELKKQFPDVKAKVVLIDKNSQVLANSEPYISKKSTEILRKKGVELLLNRKVLEVKKDSIMLDKGKIRTNNVFWAAGMRASDVKIMPTLKKDSQNRIIVDESFRISGYDNVRV